MGSNDPEKAMTPHSSTLAWKIPWTEKPGRRSPWGFEESTWLSNFTFTFHFYALEKEMATHSSVLAWRIPGLGSHRVRHDWSDFAAAAAAIQTLDLTSSLWGCSRDRGTKEGTPGENSLANPGCGGGGDSTSHLGSQKSKWNGGKEGKQWRFL